MNELRLELSSPEKGASLLQATLELPLDFLTVLKSGASWELITAAHEPFMLKPTQWPFLREPGQPLMAVSCTARIHLAFHAPSLSSTRELPRSSTMYLTATEPDLIYWQKRE